MANQSLARIMFGTTEERYLPPSAASAVPAASNRSMWEVGDKQTEKTETLGALLHRAWNNLSGKH